jgi:signal transduction histidine kinase/ActR/RegA family two-component response regulator
LLDENGARYGVLAQLIHNPKAEKVIGGDFLDNWENAGKDAKRTKDVPSQQLAHKVKPEDAHQNDLFQRFAELLPNGLAILDSNAEAIFVNDGFFKLTTKKSDKDFRAWPESIDPRDYERVMTAYRQAFSSRQQLRVDFRCAGSEQEQWRLFLLRPLREESDAGFICAVVDITEIKSAELAQEKAAAEAQERKEQQERFIDMVSHEIRNPLSAVLHLADEIKEATRALQAQEHQGDGPYEDIIDAADTILLCVQHQNTLVDDILSFSKLDSMMLSLSPQIVNPEWEFSLALKVFQSELKSKGITFKYVLDVSYEELKVDLVVADLTRIKQVLINLVTNAIKFTAKKDGERHISVALGAATQRPTSYPPDVVFFETDESKYHLDSTLSAEWGQGRVLYLMVSIKDTGIGIGAEDQARLFERFRQATPKTQEKYGGSGLGLFISRKICQLHGGDIGVSSKEGEGSTFGFFYRVRLADRVDGVDSRPSVGRGWSSRSLIMQRSHSSRSATPQLDGETGGGSRGEEESSGYFPKLPEHRPQPQSLSSHPGLDENKPPASLTDPPVEYRAEAHPAAHKNDRFEETSNIAQSIASKRSSSAQALQEALPTSLAEGKGETDHQASTAQATSDQQSKDLQGRTTLLLVEDNLINQKVLRRQLQARGFQVSVASNGQDAIDAVKRRADEVVGPTRDTHPVRAFDAILMDQEMPVKDGNAATSEIRDFETERQVVHGVILGVSANVREAQKSSMLAAGMDDVVSKPYKVDDLVKRIRKMLSEG